MTLTVPEQLIQRDHFDRPLVVPLGGGKPVPYTRCTTYVSCLEDTYNLGKWMQRMVAKGLAQRPDLLLAVAATDLADKDRLDTIVDDAREAAAASAAATIGTAVHKLTEKVDRGEHIGVIPAAYQPDIDAYTKVTEPLTVLLNEQFMVLDDLRIGGTPDRVVTYQGRNYIADVKTGSIEYGMAKIEMQLAVYSRSRTYDPATHQRGDLPNVDQDQAIVIHLPAGTGRCELVFADIAAGWEGVQLATQVREWRKHNSRNKPKPVAVAESTLNLDHLIATAGTVDELVTLWTVHQPRWEQSHTDLAAARKSLLLGGVAATQERATA